jgi:cyclopropane-fatty-acyl-phospholipid synthase
MPFSLDPLINSGLIPDVFIRIGIRHLLGQKLRAENTGSEEDKQARLIAFVEELKTMPLAIETDAANEQHYEVPSAFYDAALGPRKKYSSAYWPPKTNNLADAEIAMLKLTAQRADIQPGQHVLDLGCGWGSFSLWAAENYPDCQFTGFSNSHSQREFIDSECQKRGLTNLRIITGNMLHHDDFGQQFDRIVSVEMFEHMKNYQQLFNKVSRWLQPEGKLFIHVFTHKRFAYHYIDEGEHDWLTRYFFAGGTMPSNDLFHYFQDDLTLEHQWLVDGTHYQKTAEAWLQNMDAHKSHIMPLFAATYGETNAKLWFQRWRIFFMACAELWGYNQGTEWMVAHYRFRPR